jgi:hypothetical protein
VTKKFATFIFLLMSIDAWARGSGEDQHLISVSSGVAAPSFNPILGENPAGIFRQSSVKLQGFVGSLGGGSDELRPGAFLSTGNGTVGAGIGLVDAGADFELAWGAGGELGALNTAFGVSGIGIDSASINIGALFNPDGQLRFGAMIYDVTNGLEIFGAGLAYGKDQFKIVLDAGYANSSLGVRPGIGVSVEPLHLSVSYADTVVDEGATPVGDGINVGVGFELSSDFSLLFYYEHLYRTYFGLIYRF